MASGDVATIESTNRQMLRVRCHRNSQMGAKTATGNSSTLDFSQYDFPVYLNAAPSSYGDDPAVALFRNARFRRRRGMAAGWPTQDWIGRSFNVSGSAIARLRP
jgi:hypothetical protein